MSNDGTGLRDAAARLENSQQQCDDSGEMISVSRRALDETLAAIAALSAVAPPPVLEADEAMARHWIDRYAAGIDDEPQMDRIAEALAASPAAPAQQAVTDGAVMVRIHTTPNGKHDREPTWIEVPAMAVGQSFAVHADVTYYPQIGRTELADGGCFGVTHLPSGMNVARSPTMEGAVQAAKAMAEIAIDWANLSRDQVAALPADVMTQAKVIRAAASVDGDIFTNAEMDEAAALTSTAAKAAEGEGDA